MTNLEKQLADIFENSPKVFISDEVQQIIDANNWHDEIYDAISEFERYTQNEKGDFAGSIAGDGFCFNCSRRGKDLYIGYD